MKSTESNTEPMHLADWCTVVQETSYGSLSCSSKQLTILAFVQYIRAGNFPMYIQSLTKLVHFLTITTMYSGYPFTYVIGCLCLICIPPYNMQNSGKDASFTVKKTSHAFSHLAINQAHDQHNVVVKGDG